MTASRKPYILKVQTCNGDYLEWTLIAESPAKAVMTARELCPECEIASVRLQDQW